MASEDLIKDPYWRAVADRANGPEPPEEIYWEHEMIEHPDPREDREGYLPDDED